MANKSQCEVSSKTGMVKWFNNKAGYGFITLLGEDKKTDIFVHHSALVTKEDHYNYLVQGEYVWFNIETPDSGNYEYNANNVTGVHNGPLMCETRYVRSQTKPNTNDNDDGEEWQEIKRKRRSK